MKSRKHMRGNTLLHSLVQRPEIIDPKLTMSLRSISLTIARKVS